MRRYDKSMKGCLFTETGGKQAARFPSASLTFSFIPTSAGPMNTHVHSGRKMDAAVTPSQSILSETCPAIKMRGRRICAIARGSVRFSSCQIASHHNHSAARE